MSFLTSRLNISPLRLLPAIVGALLLLTLLPGCGGRSRVHADLLRAEAIMEEHPDSAYDILSAMRVDSAASEEDRALHALLLTQAMHKTYRIWKDSVANIAYADSLINIATDYYEKNPVDSLLMKAYYYRGEVKALTPDHMDALYPLSRSLEISLATDNHFWSGRNYNSMAHIYFRGKAYGDQVAAQKKAVEYFQLAGKNDFALYGKSELASALLSAGRHDEALDIAGKLQKSISRTDYPDLYSELADTRARALFFKGDNDGCLKEIEKLEQTAGIDPELGFFRIMALIYLGRTDEAGGYLAQYSDGLEADDKIVIEQALAQEKRNKEGQLKNLEVMFAGLSKEYRHAVNSGFNTAQELITRNAVERHRKIERRAILRMVVILILSGLVLIDIVTFFWRLYRKKKDDLAFSEEQNEMLLGEYDDFKKYSAERQRQLEQEILAVSEEKDATLAIVEELQSRTERLEDDLVSLASDIERLAGELHNILSHSSATRNRNNEYNFPERNGEYSEIASATIEKIIMLIQAHLEKTLEENEAYKRNIEKFKKNLNQLAGCSLILEYSLMNRLATEKFMQTVTNKTDSEIIDSVFSNNDGFYSNDDSISGMEERVNESMDNIMKTLREKLPSASEVYFQTIMLTLLKFDKEAIAYLTKQKDTKAVYNVVERVHSKIDSLPEKDREYLKEHGIERKRGKRRLRIRGKEI